jgi:AhpD family alkylhydroperoxidase
MCGRYGRWSRRQRIEELLGIEPSGLDDFPALYNITPGTNTWVVHAKDGKPALHSYLWGLVPYWSKDPKKGARPVNARAETAHEKPMFRKLIRERRCLIPANCYYEWREMPVGKRPYCIRMEDESPFFIGGMWDVWHAREPDALFTFTLMALAISIAVRCGGCVAYHTRAAMKAGANRQEVVETVALALYMGGGPAAVYGADAIRAFDEYSESPAS